METGMEMGIGIVMDEGVCDEDGTLFKCITYTSMPLRHFRQSAFCSLHSDFVQRLLPNQRLCEYPHVQMVEIIMQRV